MDNNQSKTTPAPFGSGDGGHPSYHENLDRVHRIPLGRKGYGAGQTECCAYCGKYTPNPKFWAYTLYGGTFDQTPAETGEEEPIDVVGFYPLGAGCARALKRQGVPVYVAPEGGLPGSNLVRL